MPGEENARMSIERERLREEKEISGLSVLTTDIKNDLVLKELWDNDKDSAYDKL